MTNWKVRSMFERISLLGLSIIILLSLFNCVPAMPRKYISQELNLVGRGLEGSRTVVYDGNDTIATDYMKKAPLLIGVSSNSFEAHYVGEVFVEQILNDTVTTTISETSPEGNIVFSGVFSDGESNYSAIIRKDNTFHYTQTMILDLSDFLDKSIWYTYSFFTTYEFEGTIKENGDLDGSGVNKKYVYAIPPVLLEPHIEIIDGIETEVPTYGPGVLETYVEYIEYSIKTRGDTIYYLEKRQQGIPGGVVTPALVDPPSFEKEQEILEAADVVVRDYIRPLEESIPYIQFLTYQINDAGYLTSQQFEPMGIEALTAFNNIE